MRMSPVVHACILGSLLAGCHGTKVMPPQRSLNGPPGVVEPITITRPVVLPIELSEVLASYRQSVIRQAHHLPADAASQFADAEVRSLTRHYGSRESELRAEVARRMQPTPVMPANAAPRAGPARYPDDPASEFTRSKP